VDLPDALVEVGEGLPGDRPVAGRFQLAAAAGGPVVTEDGPGASPMCLEVTWKISRVAVRRITTCWKRSRVR